MFCCMCRIGGDAIIGKTVPLPIGALNTTSRQRIHTRKDNSLKLKVQTETTKLEDNVKDSVKLPPMGLNDDKPGVKEDE